MIRLIKRKLSAKKRTPVQTRHCVDGYTLVRFSLCKHLNIPNRMYSYTQQQNPRHLAEICTVATSI